MRASPSARSAGRLRWSSQGSSPLEAELLGAHQVGPEFLGIERADRELGDGYRVLHAVTVQSLNVDASALATSLGSAACPLRSASTLSAECAAQAQVCLWARSSRWRAAG